jgi:hypothetical protein
MTYTVGMTLDEAVRGLPADPFDHSFGCCRNPCRATAQVPRNANTVTKTAVGIVELLPSTLLNLASGPHIAVMKTATHIAVIASDAHISGMARSDHHRGRSRTTRAGSCGIIDIFFAPFPSPILA